MGREATCLSEGDLDRGLRSWLICIRDRATFSIMSIEWVGPDPAGRDGGAPPEEDDDARAEAAAAAVAMTLRGSALRREKK